MGTLSPANDYPLSYKWVPSLLQMTTLSPSNGYPLSCKCLPSLLQMGTLSPANDYPLCCFSNAYHLCCKWVLSLQNITFRVVLWQSTANLFCILKQCRAVPSLAVLHIRLIFLLMSVLYRQLCDDELQFVRDVQIVTVFTGLTLPQSGACACVYIRITMVTTREHASPCSKVSPVNTNG